MSETKRAPGTFVGNFAWKSSKIRTIVLNSGNSCSWMLYRKMQTAVVGGLLDLDDIACEILD